MNKKPLNLAILGATGAVGRELFKIIHEYDLKYSQLKLFATSRSAGTKLFNNSREFSVENVENADFSKCDLILASAGSNASMTWVPKAVESGCFVIDNCSYWRMKEDVPLIVPEVNINALDGSQKLIANPNCSTIQLVQVLDPIHREFGLEKVIISTYQAVSGAGFNAIAALKNETNEFPQRTASYFSNPIAFNVIPQIGDFNENGFTSEEMKMVHETRKILHIPELKVTATAVRVPVFTGHSESVLIRLSQKVDLNKITELLKNSPNIQVLNDDSSPFPTPFDSEDNDNTLVGRIRKDILGENWLNLWIVSNNLRKGAALNAVQIAAHIIKKNWV